MKDPIERHDAIDCVKASPINGWVKEDLIQALETTPSAQPEPQWIPCSERLPEIGKDVLVTRVYKGIDDGFKISRYVEIAMLYGDGDWFAMSDEYKLNPKNHKVIAWMPLPEPYREEGD